MKALLKEALHVLIIKMYWATAAVWIAILLIGLLKADSEWTLLMLEEVGPVALAVAGIGLIHWIILYRKEIKK